MRELPPVRLLHELLRYDHFTGQFMWKVDPRLGKKRKGTVAGTTRKTGYVYIGIAGYGILAAHRLAWAYVHGTIADDLEIDHIDGNPSNNAIANLRPATSSEQKRNKRVQSNNRAGLKGAYYHACHKGKKWRSQIKVGDRLIFLGYFHTAKDAHAAYTKAAEEHFGEFARAA
jgi:hypothetical protein